MHLSVVFLVITATLCAPTVMPFASQGETIYYVDQKHPLAGDSNPGSAEVPFKTIQRAANVVKPGDTVVVKSGTYNERIHFPSGTSGELGKKITVRAEPRRTATMWGFDTRHANHLRIEGFNITVPNQVTNRTGTRGVLIRSDFVEVVDNYLYDITSTAIAGYWGKPWPKNADIASNRIYRCQQGIFARGDNWTVEHNEIERLVQYGSGDADYSRFFGDGMVFRNNKFFGTKREEIGTAHVDCFQTYNNNGEYATNILLENNLCRDAHQGIIAKAPNGPTIHDIIIKNNIFVDLWAWGIINGDNVYHMKIFSNIFANINHHGFGSKNNAQAEVRNNIFYNAGSNYWADETSVVTGTNNLLYRLDRILDKNKYPNDIVNADPLFVDPENRDFHLKEGSPAIDAGMLLLAVTTDFDGSPRPKGKGWDIGAYEFAEENAPITSAPPTNLRIIGID